MIENLNEKRLGVKDILMPLNQEERWSNLNNIFHIHPLRVARK